MNVKNSKISVTQYIHADSGKLFDYWLEPEKIKKWIFPSSTDTIEEITIDPRVGGTFTFTIQRTGEFIRHQGEYLTIEKPNKLAFTWAVADEEGSDRVDLKFTSKESGTEITLTTKLHPDWIEYAEPTKKAWASMLESLKKVAEYAPLAKSEMLIRKPAGEVFEALVNPEITSKFWFTKGSARLEAGKTVEWEWGQFGIRANITATEVLQDRLIRFQWPADEEDLVHRSVEITFEAKSDQTTFVRVTEHGFTTENQQLIEEIAGQTEGWTLVLAGLKAWLEHEIILNLISDHKPIE